MKDWCMAHPWMTFILVWAAVYMIGCGLIAIGNGLAIWASRPPTAGEKE